MHTKIIAIIAVLLIIAGLSACSSGIRPGQIQPDRKTVSDVPFIEIDLTQKPLHYETTGMVTAAVTAPVSSKVMGAIRQISVREGDSVAKGQSLVIIDDRDIQAKVRQAEAGLSEAENARAEVEQAIVAAGKALEAAQARQNLMNATYKRFQNLHKKESVSQQEFEEIQAQWEAATAQADQAQAMVDSLKAKKEQVNSKIQQATAAVDEARSYLSYSRIKAPFSGRVIQKTAEVGSMAAPGMPLLVLEQDGQFEFHAAVDESRITDIEPGAAVDVSIPAIDWNAESCTVKEIIPAVDPRTRTVKVKIILPENASLRSGLFGKVVFTVGRQDVIQIPNNAIVAKGALEGVFVIQSDNIVRWRVIRTGKSHGDTIDVISGLEPGERIVTGKPDQMVDGAKVEVRS